MKNLRTGTAKFDTIRAKDANGLSIQDDGGNGLFIKDGGNVGIGTTNPSSKLEVFQDLNANDIGDSILTVTNTRLNTGSGSATIGFITDEVDGNTADKRAQISASYDGTNGGKLVLSTHNGTSLNQALTIKNDGNVGIGTTNPSALLHIAPKNNVDANGDPTNESYFKVYDNATSGLGQGRNGGVILIDANYYSQASTIFAVNGRGDNKFTIKGSGNVGIGTRNPISALDVHGTISLNSVGAYVHLTNSGGDANSNDLTLTAGHSTNSVVARCAQKFIVQTFADSAYQNRLTILNNGNVGIGTTNPSYKVDIVGNNAQYTARLSSAGNSDPYGLVIQYSSTFTPTASNYFIDCLLGTTKKFSVESNGTVRSNGNQLTSDDRVKHNEEIITGAIDTIKKITPKKYIKTSEIYDHDHNFDLDSNGYPIDENGEPVPHTVEAGVIAQEVLGVDELKFAVSPETKDEDGNVTSPHGLNYNSLFTYAIAAIQEQQSIIEDLKSQNASLESRISALES